MPQMAPINWLSLFIMFNMIFLLFNMMNYYINLPSQSFQSSKKKNNYMNWKW